MNRSNTFWENPAQFGMKNEIFSDSSFQKKKSWWKIVEKRLINRIFSSTFLINSPSEIVYLDIFLVYVMQR